MNEFEEGLKQGFLEEAAQLLANTEQCFLALETSPNDASILEQIFRLAHNLKGSAKAVGFDDLGAFTHELESYLLKLKEGSITVHPACVDLLLRCNDHITMMITALRGDPTIKIDSSELLAEIEAQKSGNAPEHSLSSTESTQNEQSILNVNTQFKFHHDSIKSEPNDQSSQMEVVADTLGQLLASETQSSLTPAATPVQPSPSKPTGPNPESVLSPQFNPGASKQQDESIRVSLSRLEKLLNFVGEMVILQTVVKEQSYSTDPTLLRRTIHQMGKVTKEVQDISMSLRMVPLKQTFQKMQRIVRDTSAMLGKKVQLQYFGEETEVDKTILESLSDPLVHLIRNAVDHGIEGKEARTNSGKSEMGTVQLKAFHQSGSLVVEVQDDGAGLDPDKLIQKAVEKGLIKAGTSLTPKEAYNLIFLSGFSTKAAVTDISGRGVGMDVVKTNIQQLQGDLQIDTVYGKGTCFRIKLPLTLAIIDGMIIRSKEERYIIPLSHVHESLRPTEEDIHPVTGIGHVLSLRGETLPLYHLSVLLGKKSSTNTKPSDQIAIVIRTQAQPFSVLVDDIVGQHQIVVKQLGSEHKNLRGFSGSAILGDGKPSLILEMGELVKRHGGTSMNITQPIRRATA